MRLVERPILSTCVPLVVVGGGGGGSRVWGGGVVTVVSAWCCAGPELRDPPFIKMCNHYIPKQYILQLNCSVPYLFNKIKFETK